MVPNGLDAALKIGGVIPGGGEILLKIGGVIADFGEVLLDVGRMGLGLLDFPGEVPGMTIGQFPSPLPVVPFALQLNPQGLQGCLVAGGHGLQLPAQSDQVIRLGENLLPCRLAALRKRL